jgi:uncharacterized protein (DUF924 family)
MSQVSIEDVLSFWLGAPATTGPRLMEKFRRWYQGGPALDLEIDTRFGGLVERALDGGLEHWAESRRGRLALVILLDQWTRNLYRGSPRTYAGDVRALELALRMLELGDLAALSEEEQLFAIMPLVHAEDLAMQDQGVVLAERIAGRASLPELEAAWAVGAARTRHYRSIIAQFGRFPHRNAVLGRRSTPEELAFLRAEEGAPSPLAAANTTP